jgi:hypothetical protein
MILSFESFSVALLCVEENDDLFIIIRYFPFPIKLDILASSQKELIQTHGNGLLKVLNSHCKNIVTLDLERFITKLV